MVAIEKRDGLCLPILNYLDFGHSLEAHPIAQRLYADSCSAPNSNRLAKDINDNICAATGNQMDVVEIWFTCNEA